MALYLSGQKGKKRIKIIVKTKKRICEEEKLIFFLKKITTIQARKKKNRFAIALKLRVKRETEKLSSG